VPSSRIVVGPKTAAGGPPEATVLVSGDRLGLLGAVYVNAHAANALKAEETIRHSGHLTTATVPGRSRPLNASGRASRSSRPRPRSASTSPRIEKSVTIPVTRATCRPRMLTAT
jgi:hypothetical protein